MSEGYNPYMTVVSDLRDSKDKCYLLPDKEYPMFMLLLLLYIFACKLIIHMPFFIYFIASSYSFCDFLHLPQKSAILKHVFLTVKSVLNVDVIYSCI